MRRRALNDIRAARRHGERERAACRRARKFVNSGASACVPLRNRSCTKVPLPTSARINPLRVRRSKAALTVVALTSRDFESSRAVGKRSPGAIPSSVITRSTRLANCSYRETLPSCCKAPALWSPCQIIRRLYRNCYRKVILIFRESIEICLTFLYSRGEDARR